LGAGAGFEPAILRASEGQKAQWEAQNVVELLRVVRAWPNLRPKLKATISAIVGAGNGYLSP